MTPDLLSEYIAKIGLTVIGIVITALIIADMIGIFDRKK